MSRKGGIKGIDYNPQIVPIRGYGHMYVLGEVTSRDNVLKKESCTRLYSIPITLLFIDLVLNCKVGDRESRVNLICSMYIICPSSCYAPQKPPRLSSF